MREASMPGLSAATMPPLLDVAMTTAQATPEDRETVATNLLGCNSILALAETLATWQYNAEFGGSHTLRCRQ